MGGRGRGRGGGGMPFSREQLNAIGGTEVVPGPVTQPPPLYPLLERKPVPLTSSLEMDYLLVLKQDFLDHMQFSGAFLKMPQPEHKTPDEEIDKLLAQLPNAREKFDWNLFPAELRPKILAKRTKIAKKTKQIDVENRLNRLEEMENKGGKEAEVTVKTEEIEEDDEEELPEEEADEEMDDGTDYVNNYFDNGEAFEEEDDNLDDGPIY